MVVGIEGLWLQGHFHLMSQSRFQLYPPSHPGCKIAFLDYMLAKGVVLGNVLKCLCIVQLRSSIPTGCLWCSVLGISSVLLVIRFHSLMDLKVPLLWAVVLCITGHFTHSFIHVQWYPFMVDLNIHVARQVSWHSVCVCVQRMQ